MQLQSGCLLQGGKYRIERVLGQGGFGITYQAVQVALNRKVAIKEFFMKEYCNRDSETSHVSIPSEGSKELVGKFRQKFIKEAQNIAALNHPHIIRIHDIFEENGTAYYVMEYCDKGSLGDLVKRQGALDESEALRYIRQVADALGYIHERKMNHLDVKPGNILLDENRNAVLIDFGLSKRYDEEGNQTSTTPVGISHGYAPLEQYKKGGVGTFSPATDIYSLGATLYKLLTAKTPPEANDVMDDGLPALPSSVSSATASAIEKAMQPTRRNRPQSVKELLGMLDAEPVEEEESEDTELVVVDEPTPQPEPVPVTQSEPKPASGADPIPVPTSSWKKWAGIVAVGILVVLGIILWPKGEEKKEPIARQVETRQQSKKPVQEQQLVKNTEPKKPASTPVVEKTETAPAPSLLSVTTSPAGATVYVDGKKVGTTPIESKEIVRGRHTVKISKSGYESISEKKDFGEKPVVLNKTLKEEVKEEPVSTQPVVATPETTEVKQAAVTDLSDDASSEENEIYQVAEIMPEFPGGTQELMKFLQKNVKYPSVAAANGVQGRVIVQFVVNKDGSIVDPVVLRSVDPYLDKEALRVVKSMPKWKPGEQRGKKIRVKYTLPISFRLN